MNIKTFFHNNWLTIVAHKRPRLLAWHITIERILKIKRPEIVTENIKNWSHCRQRIRKRKRHKERETRVLLSEKLTALPSDPVRNDQPADQEIQDADHHGDQRGR